MEERKISPANTQDCLPSPARNLQKVLRIRGAKAVYDFGATPINKASPKGYMDVEIHPKGKIIDKKYLWRGITDLTGLLDDTTLLSENKALLRRFLDDAELGKTIKGRAKKKIGPHRLLKYLQDLKKLDAYFQKPLDAVTQEDMERFILDLEKGRYKKHDGKPYAAETQVCLKKIIMKFYRWLGMPTLVEWFDTSCEIRDYRAIKKEQVEAILTLMTSNSTQNLLRNRAIIMFMFDSGVRAQELINIRLENLDFERGNYKARVQFSKTKPRTLKLPLCKEQLEAWLDRHPARTNKAAQLFPINLKMLSDIVSRAGKVINQRLTPHGLRHSSATYWARHLSRYQLCYRFGWAMSSKQPDRYIDQEGLDDGSVTEAVEIESSLKLSRENELLNQRLAMMEEQMRHLLTGDMAELEKVISIVEANRSRRPSERE